MQGTQDYLFLEPDSPCKNVKRQLIFETVAIHVFLFLLYFGRLFLYLKFLNKLQNSLN